MELITRYCDHCDDVTVHIVAERDILEKRRIKFVLLQCKECELKFWKEE